MQVGLCNFVDRVVAGAVFSAAALPALALVTNLPGRNDVFPLDTCCSIGILARDITTGFEVDQVAGVLAPTIELGGLWRVEFPGDLFGFTEGLRRSSMCAHSGKEAG